MPLKLFGFAFEKTKKQKREKDLKSFTPIAADDGSIVVEGTGGFFGTYVDIDGTIKNEYELVTRYREMAQQPECDSAIDDIVNEALIYEDNNSPVSLNLDQLEYSEAFKEKVRLEFERIKILLDFNNQSYKIFRNWYIDGRLPYQVMIDEDHPEKGIQELRYLDPRQIRKIKEVQRTKDEKTGVDLYNTLREYYIYNQRGIMGNNIAMTTSVGIQISLDSIVYCHSGELDPYSQMIVSYLHKAYKVYNQLRMIEDALVIYRLSRAPERRIFYIDVGSMPKVRAEAYIKSQMDKYKSKIVYDAATGEVRNDKKYMAMLEDFWLPRREGASTTQVETLKGGENLGEITDIEYFQKKLFKALKVPYTRIQGDNPFSVGRSTAISRDEVKFSHFITRLRGRFSILFDELLEKQLILKKIISPDEWVKFREAIYYDFQKDSYFSELKDNEILADRIDAFNRILPLIGTCYSMEYARKNILKQTDEDIEEIDKQIEEEKKVQVQDMKKNPELYAQDGDGQVSTGEAGDLKQNGFNNFIGKQVQ